MSTIADFGIPGVGSGILQPKIKNLWRVTFANMGGGTNSTPVSMQTKTFTRPKLSFQEIEIHRYNSTAYVQGKHAWDPCTMNVEDDVSGTAAAVLQAQLQKQQWLVGAEGQWLAKSGEGSLYKFVTHVDMLDGNDQVIETWTLEGCWLKDIDWGELDYGDGQTAVTIPVTIRYDHARQSIGGYKQGPGIATGGGVT